MCVCVCVWRVRNADHQDIYRSDRQDFFLQIPINVVKATELWARDL